MEVDNDLPDIHSERPPFEAASNNDVVHKKGILEEI